MAGSPTPAGHGARPGAVAVGFAPVRDAVVEGVCYGAALAGDTCSVACLPFYELLSGDQSPRTCDGADWSGNPARKAAAPKG